MFYRVINSILKDSRPKSKRFNSNTKELDIQFGVEIINKLIKFDYNRNLNYIFTNLITAENLYLYITKLYILK